MFELYTDGGGNRKTGIGGYGLVILCEGMEVFTQSGAYFNTTTNRMELMGVVHGLGHIPEGATVRLTSDSLYVINNLDSIDRWTRKNWVVEYQGVSKPVANADLWKQIGALRKRRTVLTRWVKGHTGDRYNELADTLATKAQKYSLKVMDMEQPKNSAPDSTTNAWESDL